ncbi:MAG: cysteine desulfurase family protein [Proteobacteria bacterium]|nr:cysteine desulfurase family protein [Pseudomonadota bacterium]
MFAPVYFDYNATTPVDARVLEAMLPHLRGESGFGNASSRHDHGREARKAIDEARQQVAAAVGAHPTEVVFTSGGSESNNLFLKGAAACIKPGPIAPVIAISAIEHPCVRETARDLVRAMAHQGWKLREIAVDDQGRIDAGDYAEALALWPRLLSVMLANNETGTIQDIPALARQARAIGGWFHTDAVQALGKLDVNFRELNAAGVHAMTVSAHKIHGPKGAGALVLDKRIELRPLISGGGQERGLRSGTENVAAIVGFGRACELIAERLKQDVSRFADMRSELERGLMQLGATVFSQAAQRLPNTVYFALPGIDGETLVGKLDRAGYAVASGAACSSANPEPSHVLQAMGVAPEIAREAVRISLGSDNNVAQIADFLAVLSDTVFKLRRLSALAG